MRDLQRVIRACAQKPPADKIDFLSKLKNMWISEEVDSRLREYIITQMLNYLRFLLTVNDIKDSGTKTFDEVCVEERKIFITENTRESLRAFYKLENLYIPNYNCLWDIIFNDLGFFKESYTPILSAYCRNNEIMTKSALYIKMSAELDSWINTIKRFEDIVVIAIGMSRNFDIWYTFIGNGRNLYNDDTFSKYHRDILEILIKNNFEHIDPDAELYGIRPIKPVINKYDDPWQQVFYKYIMIRLIRNHQHYLTVNTFPDYICDILSRIIMYIFEIYIPIHSKDENIKFNNIEQVIDYFESKIPQYPNEIKDQLSILKSTNVDIPLRRSQNFLTNLAKMAELSNYNLCNLPIYPIVYGYCGATKLSEIPFKQIPEYYAKLTQSYSGLRTKAARR